MKNANDQNFFNYVGGLDKGLYDIRNILKLDFFSYTF